MTRRVIALLVVGTGCVPPPPVPVRPLGHSEARALELVRTAKAASAVGDCETVVALAPLILQADELVFDQKFFSDPKLVKCHLAAQPPRSEPPPAHVATVAALAPEPRVADAGPPNRQRIIGLAAVTAGVIALGVSAWAALDASSERDDARAMGCNSDLTMCPMSALPTAQTAYSRGNLATAFAIGGLVFVGVGVGVYVTSANSSIVVGGSF